MKESFLEKPKKYLHTHFLKNIILFFVGLLLLHGAQAQNIAHLDATFSVEYNNKITQGENRLIINSDHNNYEIDFDLDHWMLSSSQKAKFKIDNCNVQPTSYVSISKRPFKAEINQTLTFDWEQKKAKYTSEGKEKTFDLNTILYDPLSFFFEARCGLIAGKTEFSYPLIYKGGQKTHVYKVIGKEMVKTGQGTVEALVIERERKNKKRQTRLYVAPSLDYLLVKIEHQESSLLKVQVVLKHMDYQLTNN